jgi:regulator of sigma E protease
MFMGPALFKKQVGETLYSIRTIPIGGYCAMEGEDEDTDNPRSFQKAAWWKRLIILVAGSGMNLLLGVVIMMLIMLPVKKVAEPVINAFEDFATVNCAGGLQVGDRILEVDGEKVYLQSDFSTILSLNPGDIHDLVVERNGEKVSLPGFKMERHEVTDENGNKQMLFGMNFQISELDFAGKLEYGWYYTLNCVRNVRLSLQMLFTGKVGIQEMAGPVGIIDQMSDVATSSESWFDAFLNLSYFGGFLAINLAVMNLLPIPALDGGRVVCLLLTTAVEGITRKKIDSKYEGYLHAAGMILLLGFMAVVMFKDIFVIFKG